MEYLSNDQMRILSVLTFTGWTVIFGDGALHSQAGRMLDLFNTNTITTKLTELPDMEKQENYNSLFPDDKLISLN